MPVVIALLNSYSGLAAAATGFVINNTVLIIAGSLVGASGVILTNIMCKAMNRSLTNVLFGAMGATESTMDADEVYKTVKAMHDNAKAMTAAFPGMRLFRPDHMAKALAGVSYHAGAEKYYKEIGQWPPKAQ